MINLASGIAELINSIGNMEQYNTNIYWTKKTFLIFDSSKEIIIIIYILTSSPLTIIFVWGSNLISILLGVTAFIHNLDIGTSQGTKGLERSVYPWHA